MRNKQIIKQSEVSMSTFLERVGVNAPGNAVLGDCLVYACAYCELFNGESVFMINLPDSNKASEPMHVGTKIDGDYYDGRGKVMRSRLIDEQVEVMKSDFSNYINDKNISDIRSHVEENAIEVNLHTAKGNAGFDQNLFNKIVNVAENEIKRLDDGLNLSPDKTKNRGPDF